MKKKGVILVLGGGCAKGYAHIGLIEVLEENKIPIAGIVGASAGALVGGIYCTGNLQKFKKKLLSMNKFDIFKMFASFPIHGHILNRKKMDRLIKKNTSEIKIEDLKIPFIAIGFNASEGEKMLIDKGSLYGAIRISVSIPGVFEPINKNKCLLVDGGVLDLVPVDVAKEIAKKNKIIAIDVNPLPHIKKKHSTFLDMIDYEEELKEFELARLQEEGADMIIHLNVKERLFEFHKAKKIIREGRKAAEEKLPEIKNLLKK